MSLISGAEKAKTFQVADFFDKNFPGEKARKSCFRHFATNARESEKFPGGLECFQMTRKASRWPGNFPDGLETSRWPGNFLDGLETFQLAWKLSTWPRNFPHGLESVHMVWKVSRFFGQFYAICPGKFPDDLKSFPSISQAFTLPRLCSLCLRNLFQKKKKKKLQKLSRFTKTFQVALLPCYLGFSASV